MRPSSILGLAASILVAGCVRPYEIRLDSAATIQHPLFHVARPRIAMSAGLVSIRFTPCFGAKYATDKQAAWVIVRPDVEGYLVFRATSDHRLVPIATLVPI